MRKRLGELILERSKRKRLGEILVERTNLAEEDLERALRLQKESGDRLGALLLQLGMISERDLANSLAEQLGLEVSTSDMFPQAPVLDGEVTREFLQQAKAIPVAITETKATVVMADPLDRYTIEALSFALGRDVKARVGLPSEIEAAIQAQYGDGASSMEQIVDDFSTVDEENTEDIQQLRDLASEAPIIRLVNIIIGRALEARASDIHIEPFENTLKTRYRIDGVLKDVEAPPVRSTAAVISRIKVMANLNIAERRLPQDGRIKLRIEGREIDMRISTIPTMHGESVVMRILDKGSVPLEFATLGFEGEGYEAFKEILARPQGIILVTGPTGSGKTTTLYAALQSLNTPEKKILTVEDPVEYQLEGINQIQIKPQIGLSFASALRSILRQDPDVIMVGEMRDLETGKIAVQSALTGHKVFSTLHTNDASSSVTRLLDMGIEDYLVTSTVDGIVAQRLVRNLCATCREPYTALPELVDELRLTRFVNADEVTLYRPKPGGCEACEGTGFFGRCGIIELLVMSDPVRSAILEHGDAGAIRRAAREAGTTSMHDDGLRKAVAGVTTIEEVERATEES